MVDLVLSCFFYSSLGFSFRIAKVNKATHSACVWVRVFIFKALSKTKPPAQKSEAQPPSATLGATLHTHPARRVLG